MTYIVRFEFRNEIGEWKADYINNNDKGMPFKEAEQVAYQLRERGYIRNVEIAEWRKGEEK